jgi:hypothetical protein
MISPTLPQIWRAFAQGCMGVFIQFAMVAPPRHCFLASLRQSSHGLRSLRCYPSPSLRSGPSQAGPILMCDPCNADCESSIKNCFQICDIAVKSGSITTNLRGSTKCRSRLSSSPFLPCHWPDACRTLRPAEWRVRPLARWSPMRWMKTCWPGQPLAALPVSQPAASSLACRPVTRATKLAAFGRLHTTTGTIRAARPGGPFAFPLGGADV